MDSTIFRKDDASSCLVVDKTWKDIINRPTFFDDIAKRIVMMTDAAEVNGLLSSKSTLRQLKTAINNVLMTPLTTTIETDSSTVTQGEDTILVDALWDEISHDDEEWQKIKEALQKAYNMKIQIGNHDPIASSDSLGTVKENFNETILEPLLDINQE